LEMRSMSLQHELDRERSSLSSRVVSVRESLSDIVTSSLSLRENITRWTMFSLSLSLSLLSLLFSPLCVCVLTHILPNSLSLSSPFFL
jgi:hypothetical protein